MTYKEQGDIMKRFIAVMVSITFFALLTAVADEEQPDADETLKVGDAAPEWTLQDAEKNDHVLKELQGKVVLLVMGNRKIRDESNKWANRFREDYAENAEITAYIVGDMRFVPRFTPKALIRRHLRKNPPPLTVLLDWKGKVHQLYKTEEKKPTICLISQEGIIAFHQRATLSDTGYAELKQVLTKLLTKPAPVNNGQKYKG